MLKRTSRHNDTAEPLATKAAAALEHLVLTLAQRDVNAKCYHCYYQLRENFKNFVVVKDSLWKGSINVWWGGISLSFQILPCVCMWKPQQQQNPQESQIDFFTVQYVYSSCSAFFSEMAVSIKKVLTNYLYALNLQNIPCNSH